MVKSVIDKVGFIALLPFYYLVYFLSGLFPRNNKLWVFGSWNGKRFADNSKGLFLHCQARDSNEKKYIWISKSRKVVTELRGRGLDCEYLYSVKGAWYSFRAGVYVFDSFSRDISFWTSRKALKVLLMHGVPIKKIGRDIDITNNIFYKCYHGTCLQKMFFKVIRPWWLEKYDLVPSTSPYTSQKFQSAFALSDGDAPITGFSRNDMLYSSQSRPVNRDITLQRKFKKKILYAPTFRDSNRTNREIPLDWRSLDGLMQRNNSLFILKLHPNEQFEIDLNGYPHIKVLDKGADIYDLLKDADLLISDYSSVSLDFMGTRKPVVFYTYDLSEYSSNDRSLYLDFEELFDGSPIAKTYDQLYNFLINFFEGELSIPESYERKLSFFHVYTDAFASERIKVEIEKRCSLTN